MEIYRLFLIYPLKNQFSLKTVDDKVNQISILSYVATKAGYAFIFELGPIVALQAMRDIVTLDNDR